MPITPQLDLFRRAFSRSFATAAFAALDGAGAPGRSRSPGCGMMRGLIAIVAVTLGTTAGLAQTARDIRGPAGVVPLTSEPPAHIVVDPPLADSLSHGRVVIQYRTENLRIVQVFGPAALAVSPRIGHVHVTVDDAPWRWADASGEPLIINGLPAGPHRILVELVDANHQTLDQQTVGFVIPAKP